MIGIVGENEEVTRVIEVAVRARARAEAIKVGVTKAGVIKVGVTKAEAIKVKAQRAATKNTKPINGAIEIEGIEAEKEGDPIDQDRVRSGQCRAFLRLKRDGSTE